MLYKKKDWFWKIGLIAISILLFATLGCSATESKNIQSVEKENKAQVPRQNDQDGAEEIIGIFTDFYDKSVQENSTADLEMLCSIVGKLGERGYPAVDSRNQIDMVEAERVIGFCESVDAKEESKITIIEVITVDTFIKYDLKTKDGNVDVTRNYYKYENGVMQPGDKKNCQAGDWNYTEDGYLMFTGAYFEKELYALTLSGMEEHAAFRVLPLDETLRELNRKYLIPIGYERNNMFLAEWSEADFADLDFYDLFDIFYPKVEEKPFPYVMDDNLGAGAVYRIPKAQFERVIMAYFNIESETLQSKTAYNSEDETYEYKPRGFYEVEYPEYPYPEVTGYTENSDGTITLTAHVVFPYTGDSNVYVHEVVVRPTECGGTQYVSNRIIGSKGEYEQTWHVPRLTEEAWNELYGGK